MSNSDSQRPGLGRGLGGSEPYPWWLFLLGLPVLLVAWGWELARYGPRLVYLYLKARILVAQTGTLRRREREALDRIVSLRRKQADLVFECDHLAGEVRGPNQRGHKGPQVGECDHPGEPSTGQTVAQAPSREAQVAAEVLHHRRAASSKQLHLNALIEGIGGRP